MSTELPDQQVRESSLFRGLWRTPAEWAMGAGSRGQNCQLMGPALTSRGARTAGSWGHNCQFAGKGGQK